MKKLLFVCAAVICAFQVHAQTESPNQSSQSASTSSAIGGGAGGNAAAISGGGSGGSGGSGGTSVVSGLQNYVIMSSPEKSVSTVNSNQTGTLTTNLTGGTDSTQRIIQSGESVGRVEYGGTYTLKNVPSVGGPPLTTSNDTCMGSSSGSANGPGFGIGFGTTWTDEHCKDLKTSRELWNKGMKAASLAVDCMNPRAKLALEMTGTKCPQSMTVEERQAAFGAQASAEGAVPSPGTPVAANAEKSPVITASFSQGRVEHLGR
ncbi:MAG: hypothetical protein ABIR13_00670 [Polaromonas sp.]